MKELLILNFVLDTAKKKEEINSRSETLSLCKTTHYILEKGNDSLGFLKEKIAILSKLFKAIKPNFDSIVNARTFFLENKKRNKRNTKIKNYFSQCIKFGKTVIMLKL